LKILICPVCKFCSLILWCFLILSCTLSFSFCFLKKKIRRGSWLKKPIVRWLPFLKFFRLAPSADSFYWGLVSHYFGFGSTMVWGVMGFLFSCFVQLPSKAEISAHFHMAVVLSFCFVIPHTSVAAEVSTRKLSWTGNLRRIWFVQVWDTRVRIS
jgi:hypothetical protein